VAADLEQTKPSQADQARVNAARANVAGHGDPRAVRRRTGFRQVSVGSYVSAGTPITTLDDTSVIQARLHRAETYLSCAARLAGEAAATGLPGRAFAGEVTNIESRVDPITRSIVACAPSCRTRKVVGQGMFNDREPASQVEPTLLVPEEALVPERAEPTSSSCATTSSNGTR